MVTCHICGRDVVASKLNADELEECRECTETISNIRSAMGIDYLLRINAGNMNSETKEFIEGVLQLLQIRIRRIIPVKMSTEENASLGQGVLSKTRTNNLIREKSTSLIKHVQKGGVFSTEELLASDSILQSIKSLKTSC